jgi:hypothetical protein
MTLKEDYNATNVNITGGYVDAPVGTRSAQPVIASPLISKDAAYLSSCTVIDGVLVIAYAQGTLPSEMASTDTTYDFQREMTEGDFILLRWGGQFEYITVGAVDSGTEYAITRDSTSETWGALDWPINQPYIILGQEGAGRLELSAEGGAPRLRIIEQGATADAETTLGVLGELNGHYGISTSTIGLGLGVSNGTAAPTGAVLTVDATNGMKIGTSGDETVIDAEGITLEAQDDKYSKSTVKWEGTTTVFEMWGQEVGSISGHVLVNDVADKNSALTLEADAPATKVGQILLRALSGTTEGMVQLSADSDDSPSGGLVYMHDTAIALDITGGGDVTYYGALKSAKNSTTYTGYIYIPLAANLTASAFDGDSFSDVSWTKIDTSAVFSAPAGIKAAMVRLIARDSATWGTAGLYVDVGPDGSAGSFSVRPAGGDVFAETVGVCPCDANGDFYYRINASGSNTLDLYIQIMGYYI